MRVKTSVCARMLLMHALLQASFGGLTLLVSCSFVCSSGMSLGAGNGCLQSGKMSVHAIVL